MCTNATFAVIRTALLHHCKYGEAVGLGPSGPTTHTLAPPKEAFYTLLSPPPLDEPGSATGLSCLYPCGTLTRWDDPVFRTHHTAITGCRYDTCGSPSSCAGYAEQSMKQSGRTTPNSQHQSLFVFYTGIHNESSACRNRIRYRHIVTTEDENLRCLPDTKFYV